MDAHIAESSTLRERTTENDEKRKKKQPRERNYGVRNKVIVITKDKRKKEDK